VTFLFAGLIVAFIFGLIIAVLVHFGFRAGDQPGDATVKVGLTWAAPAGAGVLQATVAVQNPAPTPVTVSVQGRPVSALALLFCDPRRIHVPVRERWQLSPSATLLGVVEGGRQDWWRIPLDIARPGAAAKVVVRLDQSRGRTRFLEYLIPIPRRPWVPPAGVPHPVWA
jgi:hypothetical protein